MRSISHLVAEMAARKILLSPAGEKIAYKAPSAALTAQDRAVLHGRRSEFLVFLKARAAADRGPFDKTPGKPIPTFSQEALWWFQKKPNEKTGKIENVYQQRLELRTFATITHAEIPAAKRALRKLVAKHDVLRTMLRERGRKLDLTYNATEDFTIEHDRWRDVRKAVDVEKEIRDRIDEFSGRVPGSRNRWLFFVKILETSPHKAIVIFTLSHMICDRSTLGLLTDDFRALLAKRAGANLRPHVQQHDYAQWERKWYTSEKGAVLLDYWLAWLTDQPVLYNPENGVKLEWVGGSRAIHNFTLPPAAVARIRLLAKQLSTSVLLIYLTVFGMTSARLFKRNCLPLRCKGDTRIRKELLRMPGIMGCSDPVEFRVLPDESFADTVRAATIERLSAMQMRLPNTLQLPPHPLRPGVETWDINQHMPLAINYVSHEPTGETRDLRQLLRQPLAWPPPITAVAHEKLPKIVPVNFRLMQMDGSVYGKVQFHEGIFSPDHQAAFIATFFDILGKQIHAVRETPRSRRKA